MLTDPQEPELRFILDCLTHDLWPERPLPIPSGNLNWDRAYELLGRNRLAGQLHVWGKKYPDLWPKPLLDRMRRDRIYTLLYGDHCIEQVKAILTALKEAGIPTIVLKGWALIQTLYEGDYSQRPFDDIDLLVAQPYARQAEEVLGQQGFRGQLTEFWPGYHRRYRNSRAFLSSKDPAPFRKPFMIGLHWGLLDTPYFDRYIDIAGLCERSQPLEVANVPVRGLALEDHLVYACGHLALHHEYGQALFRYYEAARQVRQTSEPIDWQLVLARAASWHLTVPTQTMLTEMARLWPGIIPTDVLAAAKALRPTRAERLVHDCIVAQRENHSLRALVAWLTLPGFGRRCGFLFETAFPSRDFMLKRYGPAPRGIWPLLYLHRFAAALGYLRSEAPKG